MDADGAALVLQAHAELGQSQFGMIARADRLDDRRDALGEQPAQQHRRLHLRARNRPRVFNRGEARALDLERRVAAIAGANPRAHPRQRLDHPPHRALA